MKSYTLIRLGRLPVVALVTLLLAGCASISSGISGLYSGPYSEYPRHGAPHNLLTKPLARGDLSSSYGWRLSPGGLPRPKKHLGIDYRAPAGTRVLAAGDGRVVVKRTSSSYGNILVIEHENGFTTAYAHLQKFAAKLKKGSRVKRGQVIGFVGSTGRSTGPHLHYELRHHGQKVDPLFAR